MQQQVGDSYPRTCCLVDTSLASLAVVFVDGGGADRGLYTAAAVGGEVDGRDWEGSIHGLRWRRSRMQKEQVGENAKRVTLYVSQRNTLDVQENTNSKAGGVKLGKPFCRGTTKSYPLPFCSTAPGVRLHHGDARQEAPPRSPGPRRSGGRSARGIP